MARNDYAYGQLTRVVSGAVRDAFNNHPDYLTDKGRRSAKTSIVKRVSGTVLSFAVQAAKGRATPPATQAAQPVPVAPQAVADTTVIAGAGSVLASPTHCRIGRVRLKPSPAEIALRDENIALGAQVFALECVVTSLRNRGRERRRDATDVSRAIAAKAASLKARFDALTPSQRTAAIEAGKGRR